MYSLCITLYIKPEHLAEFTAISREPLLLTRMEPSCLWLDALQSESERGVIIVYHAYKTEADFREHLQQPYIRQWFRQIRPMLTERGMSYPSYMGHFPQLEA